MAGPANDVQPEGALDQRLPRSSTRDYLLGSLVWAGIADPRIQDHRPGALACLRRLVGRTYRQGRRGFSHLPFFLVHDLWALVVRGELARFASRGEAEGHSPRRRLLMRYENELLASLLQEPCFCEGLQALPLDPAVRPAAINRMVELLLRGLAHLYPRRWRLELSRVRAVRLDGAGEISPAHEALASSLELEDPFGPDLEAFLDRVNQEAEWHRLLTEGDLFEIENWAVLHSEEVRLGCRQIGQVEREMARLRLPRVRPRREPPLSATKLAEDSDYPVGGLAGLTNRGSFENLLRSELAYMDPGEEISLFDVRYVEGELLYYLRNDGVHRRRRRVVEVLVQTDPAFLIKSPGFDHAFCTLTAGLLARLTRDLLAIFEEDALTLNLRYLLPEPAAWGEADPSEAAGQVAQEAALLGLLLRKEINQELVTVQVQQPPDPDDLRQPGARVQLVFFCYDPERAARWRARLAEVAAQDPPMPGRVVLLGATAARRREDQRMLSLPFSGAGLDDAAQLKNDLFEAVVKGE